MSTLTRGEIDTLATILRCGGKVTVSMQRKGAPCQVRTTIVNRLAARGFVREWSRPYRGHGFGLGTYIDRGRDYDLAVTAAGCQALELTRAAKEIDLDP